VIEIPYGRVRPLVEAHALLLELPQEEHPQKAAASIEVAFCAKYHREVHLALEPLAESPADAAGLLQAAQRGVAEVAPLVFAKAAGAAGHRELYEGAVASVVFVLERLQPKIEALPHEAFLATARATAIVIAASRAAAGAIDAYILDRARRGLPC